LVVDGRIRIHIQIRTNKYGSGSLRPKKYGYYGSVTLEAVHFNFSSPNAQTRVIISKINNSLTTYSQHVFDHREFKTKRKDRQVVVPSVLAMI
jgi:hypothetical protein